LGNIVVLNPFGITHNSKADLKKNTTDKISAQNIAEYVIANPEKVVYRQQDRLAGLRKQRGFIKMLTKQCTQFLNQLNTIGRRYSKHFTTIVDFTELAKNRLKENIFFLDFPWIN